MTNAANCDMLHLIIGKVATFGAEMIVNALLLVGIIIVVLVALLVEEPLPVGRGLD